MNSDHFVVCEKRVVEAGAADTDLTLALQQ